MADDAATASPMPTEAADTLVWREVAFPGGTVYRGSLDGPRKEGKGVWTHPDGESYEGEYQNNQHHGLGVYKFRDSGKQYTGGWRDGQMHGQGVYFLDKDKDEYYCGGYEADRKHGEGLFRYGADGRATCQKWVHGELVSEVDAPPTVQAEYYARRVDIEAAVENVLRNQSFMPPPDAVAEGISPDDLIAMEFHRPTTDSTYNYPSGAVYTGGFLGSKKHGAGTWEHPSKDKYMGSFRYNKHHGWGHYAMGSGDKAYLGGWDAGKIEGWGVYYLNRARTEYYVGTFRNELKHGVGVHVLDKGPAQAHANSFATWTTHSYASHGFSVPELGRLWVDRLSIVHFRDRFIVQFQRWKHGQLLEETVCPDEILTEYERVREYIVWQVNGVLADDAPAGVRQA